MKNLFPTPKQLTESGTLVKIGARFDCGFTVVYEADCEIITAAIEKLESSFTAIAAILPPYGGAYPITLRLDHDSSALAPYGDEAYTLSVTESGATLTAASARGMLYAVTTLVSLVEVNGKGIFLPVCELLDYPDYKIRGVFAENRYNDFMSLDDWKGAVDTVADLKMNTLKVGLYGTWSVQYDKRLTQHAYIPFKSHPEIRALKNEKYFSAKSGKWVHIPDRLPTIYEEDYFGDIVKYGKKKHVEVIPLINSLGHNSLIPYVIPEISARDEEGKPTGFGICTENPETYKVFFELYDEIIDRYLEPSGIKSFAIGLDEVGDARGVDRTDLKKLFSAHCKCEKCRDIPIPERMISHMVKLVRHLKERGMTNVYVYYDMFFYSYGMMNETLANILKKEDIYDVTVMDWWNYGASTDFFRGKYKEVNGLFRSIIKPMSGYFGWANYDDNCENMAYCSNMGKKWDFEGMISYANFDPRFEMQYYFLAESAWNAVGDVYPYMDNFNKRFFGNKYPDHPEKAVEAWKRIQHRLHPYNYTEKPPTNGSLNQYSYSYLIVEGDYPREHYSTIFAKFDSNPDFYLNYIKDYDERTKFALDFFGGEEAEPSLFNSRLVADLDSLNVNNTELMTLYNLYRASADGKLENQTMISELRRLIRRRKRAMIERECATLENLVSQPMRIMSISLVYLEELLEDVLIAEREGRTYVYDPRTAIDRDSKIFHALH